MNIARRHAEKASRFYFDQNLKCWVWLDDSKEWDEVERPTWDEDKEYFVGYVEPKNPPLQRMTLSGITFNRPSVQYIKSGDVYYYPNLIDPSNPHVGIWPSPFKDQPEIAALYHRDRQAAVEHARALIAYNLEQVNK